MKKVFLAVLAAGLFFACNNDTKDKAVNEEVTNETETTVDEPTPAPEAPATEATPTENTTAQPTAKKEDKNEIKEDIEAAGKATTDIINTASEASKASKGRGSKKTN